jgi:hypothetical protein
MRRGDPLLHWLDTPPDDFYIGLDTIKTEQVHDEH